MKHVGSVVPQPVNNFWGPEGLLFDVRESVHHSTIHKEKSNELQQCNKILLFHIYMKLNMFRATHRPSSEA
jgi:hypothetical protein